MQQGSPSLQVPRWIQLVSLPIVLLAGWLFANAVRHALFVFLISGLVALLLNPLVNVLRRARVPRGLAVLLVLLFVAIAVVTAIGIAGAAAVSQAQSVSDAATKQFEVPSGRQQSPAEERIDAVQHWLNRNGLGDVRVRDSGNQLVEKIRTHGVSDYAQRALDIGGQIATTVAQGLIELVLILVISIYLLLDGPRISEGLDRWFPPGDDGLHLGRQVQQGLINYVRGQLIVSVLIGTSSGVIVYVLSLTGVWPGGKDYALILGLWETGASSAGERRAARDRILAQVARGSAPVMRRRAGRRRGGPCPVSRRGRTHRRMRRRCRRHGTQPELRRPSQRLRERLAGRAW